MKSLREGWKPLVEVYTEYKIDSGYSNRMLKKLSPEYKEQLGRTWVVYEEKFLELLGKKEKVLSINDILSIFIDELILNLTKKDIIDLINLSLQLDSEKVVSELIKICMNENINIPTGLFNKIKHDPKLKYSLCIKLIEGGF